MSIKQLSEKYAILAKITVDEAERKIIASLGSFKPTYQQSKAAKGLGMEVDAYA